MPIAFSSTKCTMCLCWKKYNCHIKYDESHFCYILQKPNAIVIEIKQWQNEALWMAAMETTREGAGDHWVALARILMTKMVLARMTMIQTRMMSSRMISARLKVIRVGRRRRQQVWPPTPLITLFHSNEGEEFSREGRKISKSWKSHFSMGERIESFLVVWLGMSIALVWWEATHPNDTTYWVAQLGLGLQILPLETKQVFSLFSVSKRNASKTICTALGIENNAGLTLDLGSSVFCCSWQRLSSQPRRICILAGPVINQFGGYVQRTVSYPLSKFECEKLKSGCLPIKFE